MKRASTLRVSCAHRPHSSGKIQSGESLPPFARFGVAATDNERSELSIVGVGVGVSLRYRSGIAAVSVFFVVFQRFATLSRCLALCLTKKSRSRERAFCVHSLRLPSSLQNPITTSRIVAHSAGEQQARRHSNVSSLGREHDGRRHASMSSSRYAPCSCADRCRVSARYLSVQSGSAG